MGEPETKILLSISDHELHDMQLDKEKYLEMVEFNRTTVLRIYDQLPGELIKHKYYELFRDDYGIFTFCLPYNICIQLKESLFIGYWQGEKIEPRNKNLSGTLINSGEVTTTLHYDI